MSTFRLQAQHIEESLDGHQEDDSSSSEEGEEETWDDWVSDSMEKQPCRSLFDDTSLPSAEATLKYDKETHGFELNEAFSKLGVYAVSCYTRYTANCL